MFSALQDGWVVAYDDEKLEELWRFNVGTPLKGAPVVYAIGPKQYLAVQASGRHLHPVKYDNLEHSSYLFVFVAELTFQTVVPGPAPGTAAPGRNPESTLEPESGLRARDPHPAMNTGGGSRTTTIQEDTMCDCIRHYRVGRLVHAARAGLLGVSLAALAASAFAADYKMTVNKDRLINSANEPQNWLMMNGDYGSTRYSKLAQINRDNVKNLRLVWALALRGMQDVGQNGPENEVNPLIDNGFMYTSDGWGTVYKIDVRSGDHGEFVWIADPGVKHEGNVPRSRGIALWEDLVINNLPDGRVIAINRDSGEIVWDKVVARPNEFGTKERMNSAPVTAEGKVIVANGAGDGGTRGWLAGARRQDRQRAVALVCDPQAGRARQRDLEGQEQRLEDRRRRHVADRLLRSRQQAHHLGHRQSGPAIRSAIAPGRQSLYQLRRRSGRQHRQARLVLSIPAERLLGL